MSDKTKKGGKKKPIIKKKTDLCTDVVIEFTIINDKVKTNYIFIR